MSDAAVPLIPRVSEASWRICEAPDLGALNGPHPKKQHVVDHSFVRARDGRWTLWACIRGTGVGRLLYGWRGDSLERGPWEPTGVVARADARYGEKVDPESIGAPHFVQVGETYYCFYHGDGVRIMTSRDGVHFERLLKEDGTARYIERSGRDAMVLSVGEKYLCYTAVTTVARDGWLRGFVALRHSSDLLRWSDYVVVQEGGIAGNGPVSAESPFVVQLEGYFYLFRATSTDGFTYVYRSENPFDFGVNTDTKLVTRLPLLAPEIVEDEGAYYISDLADFRGIKVSRLEWVEDTGDVSPPSWRDIVQVGGR